MDEHTQDADSAYDPPAPGPSAGFGPDAGGGAFSPPPPPPPAFGGGGYPFPDPGNGGPSQPGDHHPYWTPQPPRRPSISVAVTALLVVVAVLAGVGIGRSLPGNSTPVSSASPTTPLGTGDSGGGSSGAGSSGSGSSGAASTGPADVTSIAQRIDRSLVDIEGNLSYQQEEAFGTGIILSPDGLVLTNNHVIDQSTALKVVDVATGRSYTGRVVGYDELADVALVQMEGASGLTPAQIDTSSVSVGQDVVAVGNAGGKGGTPTAAGGTITALDRSITATDEGNDSSEQLSGLIQTNADVQPGDSGGSLVDTRAQVVGMDTAASSSFSFAQSSSEGYAIPIRTALGLASQIRSGRGSATVHIGPTAFIGVTVIGTQCFNDLDQRVGPSIGQGSGALICRVVGGTAAAHAGLSEFDTITSIGGRPVTSPSSLTHILVAYHPGETTTIAYRTAGGGNRTSHITLGSGPPG